MRIDRLFGNFAQNWQKYWTKFKLAVQVHRSGDDAKLFHLNRRANNEFLSRVTWFNLLSYSFSFFFVSWINQWMKLVWLCNQFRSCECRQHTRKAKKKTAQHHSHVQSMSYLRYLSPKKANHSQKRKLNKKQKKEKRHAKISIPSLWDLFVYLISVQHLRISKQS